MNIDFKAIIEIIFNYFKAVFAFWYPEESKEVEDFINELK